MSEHTRDPNPMGESIMIARGLRGWSAHELGQRIGVPATTIRAWEQGTAVPEPDLIPVLAETLELDARDMVGSVIGEPDPREAGSQPALHAGPEGNPATDPTDPSPTTAPEPEVEAAVPPLTSATGDHGAPADDPPGSGAKRPAHGSVTTVSSAPSGPFPVQADEPHDRATARSALSAHSAPTSVDPMEVLTRAATWIRNRWRRRRLLARAPTQMRSYVEDDRQSTTYRIRQVLTGAVLIVMVLLLRWAWSQFAEAVSTLFDTLRSAV